jgi:hypothetical protein
MDKLLKYLTKLEYLREAGINSQEAMDKEEVYISKIKYYYDLVGGVKTEQEKMKEQAQKRVVKKQLMDIKQRKAAVVYERKREEEVKKQKDIEKKKMIKEKEISDALEKKKKFESQKEAIQANKNIQKADKQQMAKMKK